MADAVVATCLYRTERKERYPLKESHLGEGLIRQQGQLKRNQLRRNQLTIMLTDRQAVCCGDRLKDCRRRGVLRLGIVHSERRSGVCWIRQRTHSAKDVAYAQQPEEGTQLTGVSIPNGDRDFDVTYFYLRRSTQVYKWHFLFSFLLKLSHCLEIQPNWCNTKWLGLKFRIFGEVSCLFTLSYLFTLVPTSVMLWDTAYLIQHKIVGHENLGVLVRSGGCLLSAVCLLCAKLSYASRYTLIDARQSSWA